MAIFSYQLSLVIWRYIEPNQTAYLPMPSSSPSEIRHNQSPSISQISRAIINSYPFGKVQKNEVQPIVQEQITAPETKLNYKLRGIYYSENQSLASAIIELNNKKVESYLLNDEVEEGILIYAIELKHIVLERYGKFETLTLEEVKFDKTNKALSTVTESNSNQQHADVLKTYKKRFVNNPMGLAKKFRSIPVQEGGKTIGYKLKALRGETLLKKLNVPDNAVFTAINGVGLDKPFQALDALKSLQTADSINVTFLLDGVEQSRDFNL